MNIYSTRTTFKVECLYTQEKVGNNNQQETGSLLAEIHCSIFKEKLVV